MKFRFVPLILTLAVIIAGGTDNIAAYQRLSSAVSVASQGTIPIKSGPLVDDFDSGASINRWGGTTGTTASTGATLNASYLSDLAAVYGAGGHSLQLTYNVSNTGSWAAYFTSLGNASISSYNYLTFRVKGAVGGELFKAELHHANYDYTQAVGYNNNYRAEVYVTDYLDGGVTTGWQKVVIPLDAFANITDRTAMKELVFTFENTQSVQNGAPTSGTVYIDNISFGKQFLGFVRVDHFGDAVSKNSLGGNCSIVSEGATPHGSYAYDNAQFVDYKKSLWFYFQDVWDRTDDHRYVAYVSTVGGGDNGAVPQPRNFSAYNNLTFFCKSTDATITTLKMELHCPTYTNNYYHFFSKKNTQDPITTSWKQYVIPLTNFTITGWNGDASVVSSGSIANLGEIVFTRDGWVSSYSDWDQGVYTGAFYIDKVQFEKSGYVPDVTPPAQPSAPAISVNGNIVTLTSTASSRIADPSMEDVYFVYYDGQGVGHTIGYDYDTEDSTYSVTWNTSGFASGNYQVRSSAMDAAGNQNVSTANTYTK